MADGDPDEDVFRASLGVLHEDIEVTVVIEYTRVEQFVLHLVAGPLFVGVDKVAVGVGSLGILVEVLHVGVGGRRVEIEVVFLHVLAVVTLAVGEAEEALLEDGVLTVPQRQRKAEVLPVVGNACEPVLSPAVRPRPRLVVAEVVPCIARVAVIFTHGAPLPLGEIRSPLLPRCF